MPTGAMEATEQSGVDFLFGADKLTAEMRSEDDKALVRSIWTMLLGAKKYRSNWDKHWEKWWNLWSSNHWNRPKFSIAQATVNLVHRAVETFLGNITDNLPSPEPRATKPEHVAAAKLAKGELEYMWRHNNGIVTTRRPLRSALVTGIGWLRVDWDPTDLRGKGDVRFASRDGRSIWVSPHAEDPWLSDALYVIEARNVPREHVVRTWERGSQVPPGVWDGSLSKIRNFFNQGSTGGGDEWLGYFKTTDGNQTQGSFGGQGGADTRGLVTLLEAWTRQEDGSMRLTIIANGVVLQDGPSPYDDEKYPYVPFVGLRGDDGWYPTGLIQFIEGLQYEMNELHSYALDIIHYQADPILTMDEENLEMGAKIDNLPGALFPKIRGSEIGYLSPPGMKPEVITMQDVVKTLFDDILGNVDILSGVRPPGVNTLGGLEVLREQANVRLRMMVEDMRQSLKLVYQLALARWRQFVTDQRTIRVTAGEGEEFVEVNKVVGFDLGTSEPKRENTIPEDAEFEIEFDTAPGGPAGRQARKDEALALFQAGIIDQEAVLRDFEREDAEEILGRIAEAQDAAAKAEAAKAQAGAGAAQGVPGAGPPEPENLMAEAMGLMNEFAQ